MTLGANQVSCTASGVPSVFEHEACMPLQYGVFHLLDLFLQLLA